MGVVPTLDVVVLQGAVLGTIAEDRQACFRRADRCVVRLVPANRIAEDGFPAARFLGQVVPTREPMVAAL